MQSERSDGALYEARIVLRDLTALLESMLDRRKFTGQQQDIGLREDSRQRPGRRWIVEVEHYAFLVQIVTKEENALSRIASGGREGTNRSRWRARWRLELDY